MANLKGCVQVIGHAVSHLNRLSHNLVQFVKQSTVISINENGQLGAENI